MWHIDLHRTCVAHAFHQLAHIPLRLIGQKRQFMFDAMRPRARITVPYIAHFVIIARKRPML